jgi:hypothetical protein
MYWFANNLPVSFRTNGLMNGNIATRYKDNSCCQQPQELP